MGLSPGGRKPHVRQVRAGWHAMFRMDLPMAETQDAADRRWLRHLPLAVIVLGAVAGAVFLRDVLTYDTLAAHREALIAFRDANLGLTLTVFLAAYVAIVALSVPGATVATLTGGFLFGIFPGVVWNVGAAATGACLIFLAVRAGWGERLAERMDASDGRIKRIKEGIDANQWSMLFLLRLLPIVPFFAANLIPALLGVPLYRYAVTTVLGILPGTLVITAIGAGLGEVFDAGEAPDLGVIFTPPILLPILGLCVLAALPILMKLWRGRQA
jgi:uncharacterized membrane protein YdjX (TVP38/TMEM64 family)